ncbi:hypothetical protein BDZ97DRAFT_1917451 [Flammula alnicola]|nr:hypothetical protein BDZ97DRAFT_1917451 [Flammula alnicola]
MTSPAPNATILEPASTPQATPRAPHGFDGPDQVMVDAARAWPPAPIPPPPATSINPNGTATSMNGIPPGLNFQKNPKTPTRKGKKRSRGVVDDGRSPIGTPMRKADQAVGPPQPYPMPRNLPAADFGDNAPDIQEEPDDTHTTPNESVGDAEPDELTEYERREARARRHAAKWNSTRPAEFEPPASLKLVPTPIGGFDPIYGLTSEDLRRNVDDESLELWNELDDYDYCLAYLAFDPFEADKTAKVQKIKDFIKQLFDCKGVIVSSPGTKKASRQDRKPIHPYLITDLSQDQIEVLVQRACWSTPTLTLFVFPGTPFLSSFVMTLRGFSSHDGDYALDGIATVVSRAIQKDPAVHAAVSAHKDRYPSDYSSTDVLAAVAETVEARKLEAKFEGTTVILYNIYMRSPTSDYGGFQAWVSAVRAVKYISLRGRGTPQPIFNCSQCRGIDHPTGLCPCYDITGWHTKPDELSRNAEARGGYNSHAPSSGRGIPGRGRGHGFRGRGRGRGA